MAVAAVGGLVVSIWLLVMRVRGQTGGEEPEPVSWEDFVASMHDRLDQCELLLKQFAQKADKQNQSLQESVTQLQSSIEALEKPFSAVATRFSQVSDEQGRRHPR